MCSPKKTVSVDVSCDYYYYFVGEVSLNSLVQVRYFGFAERKLIVREKTQESLHWLFIAQSKEIIGEGHNKNTQKQEWGLWGSAALDSGRCILPLSFIPAGQPGG